MDGGRVETPFGRVGLEATAKGVCRVLLPDETGARRITTNGADAAGHLQAAAVQIREYARGEREILDFPLDRTGVDPVHRQVLEALRRIAPFGTTVTYGELGNAAGVVDPRDVGVFMARNPLPLVVPCHRVVASHGLGGYGGGVELKRYLLELEGVLPPRFELGL